VPRSGSPRKGRMPRPGRAVARRKQESPSSKPRAERVSQVSPLSHEEVAARAHALFLARGGQHGDDWADWFQAESELRQEEAGAEVNGGHNPDRGG
jgi:hypothetical protein